MTRVQSKDAFLYDIANDNGDLRTAMVDTIGAATAVDAGLMAAADKVKLDGVAAGATANAADADLLARENHTGAQAMATVTGLVDALAGKASAVQAPRQTPQCSRVNLPSLQRPALTLT